MKQRMKTFGVLCAAALVLAAACNNGDDGSSANGDGTTYAVGNIVTFEGKNYLVTKNTETAPRSAARASVNSDSGLYYQNKQAAAYREQWLQAYGVTEYVELFDITTKRAETTKGQATLDDKYLVLQDNKKVFATQQTWSSNTIFSELRTTAERTESFNALTEDTIRQRYDPDDFTFQSYPSDVSKKVRNQYVFNRNDNGTTNFDSLKKTKTFKAYVSLSKSKQQPIYNIEERPEPDGKKFYGIHDPNTGSSFFNMWFNPNGTFLLSTEGTGELGGSTSQSVYRNKIQIRKAPQYDTNKKTVDIQYEVQKTVKDEKTEWDDEWQTFGKDTAKDNTYVHVSEETIAIALHDNPTVTYDVPKAITFSAPYQDTSVALNPYTSVTFAPEEKDGKIIYTPKPDEQYEYDFIAQYAKDFVSLYRK
ncbi:MAG: hypothetical protein K2J14_06110 [Treponemataceae bacterium]|nr:hypothetical protein [Treponemataceae bacterium]